METSYRAWGYQIEIVNGDIIESVGLQNTDMERRNNRERGATK